MIRTLPDGTIRIYYKDWSKTMLKLSQRFQGLPHKHPYHPKLHDLGIERLSRMKSGPWMIQQLVGFADELIERPTDSEVLKMGKDQFRMRHGVKRVQVAYRAAPKLKPVVPASPAPPFDPMREMLIKGVALLGRHDLPFVARLCKQYGPRPCWPP